MEKKGINDFLPKVKITPEEKQKRLEEIDKIISTNKNVETTTSKLPTLVIILVIVIITLIILVNVLNKKVANSQRNNVNITEIR